jgi:hypothetical protein
MAEKVMLPTDNLTTRLDKLQSKMSEGLSTGPKDRINKMIDELKAKASGGAIPLPNLMQARRDAIEVSKEFTREVRKGSERYWSGLRQAIDDTVGDYEKINPEFSQVYRQANSLHRGLNEARIIEKFIISHPILSSTAAGGEFFLHTLGHALVGPSITAGGAVVGKLTEFAIAMKRNPGLRKAWQDVMKDASKNEVRATLNSLRKFHKEAKEEGLTD